MNSVAALFLGLVHRCISPLQNLVLVAFVVEENDHADAGSAAMLNRDFPLVPLVIRQHIGLFQGPSSFRVEVALENRMS